MPSTLPSSFASAAAGGNVENGVSRRDGAAGNDCRSRGRPNGATQTFRRTSQATNQSRDNLQQTTPSPALGSYIPHPSQQSAFAKSGGLGDTRYTKEQMLNIYQNLHDSGMLDRNLQGLFLGPWDPVSRNGAGQFIADKDQIPGPEVCWMSEDTHDPLGLVAVTEAERELFTTSVNSPVKVNSKEGGNNAATTRKSSLSIHGVTGNGPRPGTRRRETSDSFTTNGPLSPSESKPFFRNEPSTNTPPALLRRRTDHQEDDKLETKEDNGESQTPFGSLRRITTGPLSASLNGPSHSPWSAGGSRSAFESMGNFGNFAVGNTPTSQDTEKRPGFGSTRSSSRFKDLLSKTSTEEMSPSVKEKASISALEKLPEEEADHGQSKMRDAMLRNRPNRSETNPYAENIPRGGSAALSSEDIGVEQFGFAEVGSEAAQATPHGRRGHDQMSPTSTNPYTSPGNREEDDATIEHNRLQNQASFGTRRDVFTGSHDRGQPSFGAQRQGLGSLGGVTGWSGPSFGGGTPVRERSAVSAAFGDPIFTPITDLQSPGGGSTGGAFFGSAGFGSAGRSSRLGALFPPAMQDQMRPDSRNDAFEGQVDQGVGRDPFGSGPRRQDPLRALFDDNARDDPQFNVQLGAQPGGIPHQPQRSSTVAEQSSGHGPSPSGGSSTSQNLPTAQQRQMVMPDRMRWIYRDPQGNVQGPWSGLEMHDWFKAGFFTAELQVKKLEDAEYEPLAQLVRRIGNSREPFLVPQIGVPHGPPSANSQGNHWATAMGPTGAAPPFANSFPSFGTTLTAEQQNALERRKQEEQYLMARQKEHLAQQQMYMKQMHGSTPSGGSHGLQHHASAHSLQSQPSFGSITSPGGYQQSTNMPAPIQPPQPMHPSTMPPHQSREEDLSGMMDRMSFNQRVNMPYGPKPVNQQLRNEQQADLRAHEEAFLGREGRNERLEEFQEYRKHTGEIDETSLPQPIGAQRSQEDKSVTIGQFNKIIDESLSLTQQVQRAAAANEKAAAQERRIDIPPPSASPLPAPTPNRNRQHVADQLAAESRSQSQTPVEPASLAPWAQAEMPKGQSLKEIQEIEAKRAMEQEKLLAAARQAQAEHERQMVGTVPVPAPGLPATSNWASSTSPASPGPAANVWGAKATPKIANSTTATKKTLAQIQKEEEARKQRAVAQAAVQAQATAFSQAGAVAGKRYAELAGKASPVTSQPAPGWTTVGATGKVKTPATVVATLQTARAVSSGNVATVAKPRPTLQTIRTTSINNNKSKADEEFFKWAKSQLGNELSSGINADTFIQNLLMLPAEKEIIREAIYGSSTTLNGERISEEWLRRRRLAEKGIIEAADTSASNENRNSGWNEVAKKGPPKEEPAASANFKIVSKKKAKK